MNSDLPSKRLTLTGTHDKSKFFEMFPITTPTTPTSWITPQGDDDLFESSFDSFIFEEHKVCSSSPNLKKEVEVQELFRRTLPRSLVSNKCPSLSFSSSSASSQASPSKVIKFPKIKVVKQRRVKKKDYKISPKDRPLTSKRLDEILFQEVIHNKKFRCPCKKFEKSFACFTARDWINVAFEVNVRSTSNTLVDSECGLHGSKFNYTR